MEARNLIPGQQFEIPSLNFIMRNCICVRQSPSGTYAKFEEHQDTKTGKFWKTVYEYIAGTTPIKFDPTKALINIQLNDLGEATVETGEKKRGRGRKAKEIIFPQTPFSIRQLAEKESVSGTHIYLKVVELVKQGKMKIVKEERKKNQRGKATKIYQMLDFINEEKVEKKVVSENKIKKIKKIKRKR